MSSSTRRNRVAISSRSISMARASPPKIAVGPWSSEARRNPAVLKPAKTVSISTDVEGDHERRPEQRPDGLLNEQVECRFHGGRHLERSRAESAKGVGQPEHASMSTPASVSLDANARPEALARQIPRPCRG